MSQESVSLHELAENCSTRERAAEAAERDMTRLRAISWLRHRVGERFSGMVTSVRDQGFHVRLDGVLVDGFVHVSKLRDDHYVFSETQFALRGINKGNMIRLGDPVEIELEGVDPLQRDIDLRYLHTRPGARRGRGSGGHAEPRSARSAKKGRQGSGKSRRSGQKTGGRGRRKDRR